MTKYQLGVLVFVVAFAYSALLWNLDLYNLSVLLMLMSLVLSVTILWEICRPKKTRKKLR
jgi:hypothetical protein